MTPSSASISALLRSMRAGFVLIDNQTHPPSYSFVSMKDGQEIRSAARTSIVIAAERAGLIRAAVDPNTVGRIVYQPVTRQAEAGAHRTRTTA